MTASVGIVVIVTLVVALFTAPTPGVLAYHGSDRHFTNVKLPVNWERHVASKSAPASLADRVLPHSIAAKTGLKISTRAENLNATETRVSPEVLLDHNVETIQRNRTSIITFEPTVICKLYATFDTTTCPGPDKLDAQLNMLNSVYNKYAFEFRLGEVRYVYDDKIALEPVMRNSFELTDIAVQWISEFHRGDTLSLNVYIREEGLMGTLSICQLVLIVFWRQVLITFTDHFHKCQVGLTQHLVPLCNPVHLSNRGRFGRTASSFAREPCPE